MSNDEAGRNDQMTKNVKRAFSAFVLRHSFVIRHSGIRHFAG